MDTHFRQAQSPTATAAKERLSNIETLRIAAILGIVLMHGIGCASKTTNPLNLLLLTSVNAVGNMGVTLFVLISGYFGIRFRSSRLFGLWLTMLTYSLAAYGLGFWTGQTKVFATRDLVDALTPVSSMTWWFMTCYVIVYCLAPFLNRIAATLPRRQMATLLAVMGMFFIAVPTLLDRSVSGEPLGKSLPNFLLAYLLGQYIRRHGMPRWFEANSGKVFTGCAVFIFAVDTMSATRFVLCSDNNFFIVAGAVGLFCYMKKRPFRSRLVNRAASFALPLYLADASLLTLFRPLYKSLTDDYMFAPMWLAAQVGIVAAAAAIETLRRAVLGKPTDMAAGALARLARKTVGRWAEWPSGAVPENSPQHGGTHNNDNNSYNQK